MCMTLILALVDGISSETGGKAIYVKCEDRMETKVMQIADFSFKPTLTMTSIEFNINSEVSYGQCYHLKKTVLKCDIKNDVKF